MRIRFKCPKCNVGLYFDLCIRVFQTNCNFETNTSQRKADYTIVMYHFYYVQIFFEYQHIVLHNKGTGVGF